VGGGTLRDQLHKEGRIEPHLAVQYTIQMARALHHAHQRGIVHRDVKPQNMLISTSDTNELLLSDFGIAKLVDNNYETLLHSPTAQAQDTAMHPMHPSLTSVDQMVGTAEYMAPEQINRQPLDARTDVYALGIVLFQMLTGRIPFSSTTVDGLLYQQVFTTPIAAREVNPSIPEVLEQIIFRALAKAPEHRFQSAEAMAVALEALQSSPTHEFSVDNYSTYGRDALTNPLQNRTIPTFRSYNGASLIGGEPQSGQPTTSAGGYTPAGSGSFGPPIQPLAKRKFRLSYIMYSVILVLVIVLVFNRTQPWLCTSYNLLCLSSPPTSVGGNGPFTSEDFRNNDHNWTFGNQDNGNLVADITSHKYTLAIGNVQTTYFPHPTPMGTAAGPLPQNFTLTVKMAQISGDSNNLFGLSFRLQGNDQQVSSYVFAITLAGRYQLLKYTTNTGTLVKEGVASINGKLNQVNTLKVSVHGNTFLFYVNDQLVQLLGTSDHSFTDNDRPFTGGQLGVYVTGPHASFAVTSVELTNTP
jgi:serine/threonine protein kinase